MPKHECQIEITIRLPILWQLGPSPVARSFMKEMTVQLMEKIKLGLEDGERDPWGNWCGGSFFKGVKWAWYNMKIINEVTISLETTTGVTPPEEWAKNITKDGLLKACDVRILHRNGYASYIHYFIASKGEIRVPDDWNEIYYWCCEVRNIDPETDWILPNLRKGIDPLESTKEGVIRFNAFCEQHHLDFWHLMEYANFFYDTLWDCLEGETNHFQEYEKLKQEGKIPEWYRDGRDDQDDEAWVGYSLFPFIRNK